MITVTVDLVLDLLSGVSTNAMPANMNAATKATTSTRSSHMNEAECAVKMDETMCATAEQTSKHELL